jgi:hypothetical protein
MTTALNFCGGVVRQNKIASDQNKLYYISYYTSVHDEEFY